MLNEKHFGTCEQVLQEAMAAGVPAVVMNNPCECSIIQDGVTGLIARNEREYIQCITRLKLDRELYNTISGNARCYAKKHFSIEYMKLQWSTVFEKIMSLEKKEHFWSNDKSFNTPFEVFCESIGKEAANVFVCGQRSDIIRVLNQEHWKSSSKGTPKQYFVFLGGTELDELCQLYSE